MASPPPLTPPHKGEGNFAAASQPQTLAIYDETVASMFPSPLWGGVRGGGEAGAEI